MSKIFSPITYTQILLSFWRSWVRASQTYFQVQPTRRNVTQFICFCEMLYMFQAVPPPIIRSSKLYIQHRILCQTFTVNCHCRGRDGTRSPRLPRQWQITVKVWQITRCCIYSFWAPDDGLRNRLKHVEHFTEINKLCNVVSCWLYLKISFYSLGQHITCPKERVLRLSLCSEIRAIYPIQGL